MGTVNVDISGEGLSAMYAEIAKKIEAADELTREQVGGQSVEIVIPVLKTNLIEAEMFSLDDAELQEWAQSITDGKDYSLRLR